MALRCPKCGCYLAVCSCSRLPSRRECLAMAVKTIYNSAVADLGKDLAGHSPLDLMADNFPMHSLADLRQALVDSGIVK